MNQLFVMLAIVLGAFTTSTASAAQSHRAWLTPTRYTVSEIEDVEANYPFNYQDECAQSSASITSNILDIINAGQKIWKIVEAGRPVVTVRTPVAHAMPASVMCWMDLENWKPPRSKLYQVIYKNLYGMEVVKFQFRLLFNYGGGLNGQGRYLANVTIVPAQVHAAWGYAFDAEVQVGRVVNLGTIADPMAGLQIQVKWTVKTVVKSSLSTENFFVQGDGNVELL